MRQQHFQDIKVSVIKIPLFFTLVPRELLEILNQLFEKLPISAMDVVEVSPPLDTTNQITSWAGAKIIYEVLAKLNKRS